MEVDSERSKAKGFTAVDLQKKKLDKLMANIDKPVNIPERVGKKSAKEAPEFVRNVVGSSAGAGSGEFHVYRHGRRKEYARLAQMESEARKEKLDEEYQKKLEENKKLADALTEKKRAKRLKKKKAKTVADKKKSSEGDADGK